MADRQALPRARGPLTTWLLDHLVRPPHDVGAPPEPVDDPLTGDDTHLALYLAYELHYRGLEGVDDGWEWEPSLLAARARMEDRYLTAVLDDVGRPAPVADIGAALRRIIDAGGGPSLSTHMAERG